MEDVALLRYHNQANNPAIRAADLEDLLVRSNSRQKVQEVGMMEDQLQAQINLTVNEFNPYAASVATHQAPIGP